MYLRNRMLGGVSSFALFGAEDGAGAGAGGAAAGGAGGTSAGDGGDAAAAAGSAGGSGVAGDAAGDAGAAAGAGAAGAADAGGAAGATLAGGGGQDAAAVAAAAAAAAAAGGAKPVAFGEKWREDLAGGDKDAEKDLAKYTDPKAIYKSLRELQTKISKGELKAPPAPLAADATPEQKAEYRKTNGLPETAEGYVEKLALADGVVIGEADKPLVADFAKAMFESGASQGEMNRAVSWFYDMQAKQDAARAESDGKMKIDSEVSLRTEWGADFAPNMNAFGAISALMPEELRNVMFTARTPDGRVLGNTAEFVKWGAQLGRELNPAATLVVPNAGGDGAKSIGEQIAAIEKSMYVDGQPNPAYWRGKEGEAQQARYRELVDAQTKMAARGGRAA